MKKPQMFSEILREAISAYSSGFLISDKSLFFLIKFLITNTTSVSSKNVELKIIFKENVLIREKKIKVINVVEILTSKQTFSVD